MCVCVYNNFILVEYVVTLEYSIFAKMFIVINLGHHFVGSAFRRKSVNVLCSFVHSIHASYFYQMNLRKDSINFEIILIFLTFKCQSAEVGHAGIYFPFLRDSLYQCFPRSSKFFNKKC